ncbi:hypothetical protein LSH36_275g07017 [Paralvinella palmiformis]|uniref:Uncharacterized protein n=1 Tax=Paralvinella palmiformis TaxID=53620 RepID=A0AAD9JJE4_9ANNE|nr:hypothetical protein LSH36_275g07017 [Paralvinella palmiformis]
MASTPAFGNRRTYYSNPWRSVKTVPAVNNNTNIISSSDLESDRANLSQFECPAKYTKEMRKLMRHVKHADTSSTTQGSVCNQ